MALVSRATLFAGASTIANIKNIKTNQVDYAAEVQLLNDFDTVDLPQKYGFSFDAVQIQGISEQNWSDVWDGTTTGRIAKKGGGTIIFTECKLISIGEETIDGQNEMVKTITVFAKGRTDE